MGRRDRETIAKLVERHLLFDGVGEFTANFISRKRPLHLHAAEAFDEFLLEIDQFRLLVTEVKAVTKAETGDAVFTVESRQRHLFAERQFGQHDRRVDVVWPVEDSRAMREREGIAGEPATRTDERHL